MFDPSDPRSALTTADRTVRVPAGAPIGRPQYVETADHVPVTRDGEPATWFVRAHNFVLACTQLEAGASLTRLAAEQDHEYVLLLTAPRSHVVVEWGGSVEEVDEPAIVAVPQGDSVVRALRDTFVVRLFDDRTRDMMAAAINAAEYTEPHPRVAPLVPWPAPVGGDRIRVYPTDTVPAEPGRFGRIFRTRSFMVNVLETQHGPRDPEQLSPHDHEDFEQCSLVVEGRYVHHIRTPWTPRRSQWRDDEHREVGSPSVTIIPPPTVHTSEAVGAGSNRLIDIFCPPREDFSAKPGWVLNAADYPAPS